jgi:hypothetical protein
MAEGVQSRLSGVRALSYIAVAAVVAVAVLVAVGKLAATPVGWLIAGLAGAAVLLPAVLVVLSRWFSGLPPPSDDDKFTGVTMMIPPPNLIVNGRGYWKGYVTGSADPPSTYAVLHLEGVRLVLWPRTAFGKFRAPMLDVVPADDIAVFPVRGVMAFHSRAVCIKQGDQPPLFFWMGLTDERSFILGALAMAGFQTSWEERKFHYCS